MQQRRVQLWFAQHENEANQTKGNDVLQIISMYLTNLKQKVRRHFLHYTSVLKNTTPMIDNSV